MTERIRTLTLMVLCLLIATPVVANAAGSASSTYETLVVKHTNIERTHRDLKAVKRGDCVDRFAESQARKMKAKQKMFHQPLKPIMKKCGLKSVGENVAYGYPTGTEVTAAWMKSPGHKKNILRKDYRLIGVGAVKDSNGIWWVSQVFGTKK